MKKNLLFVFFLFLILTSIYFIYSKEYQLQGTYQGMIEKNLYTISFDNNKVNFFSSITKEHFSSTEIKRIDKNKYKISFNDKLEFILKIQSNSEIILFNQNKEYAFLKKSDSPIWEKGYEYRNNQ
ncbi:hypothetical protein EII17_00650 [Clostridiales bacterium COT073_COT-073]|nr:hypothetical protein EII17_00650 [Clostridiales bacterium COT073_COT-073]